MKAIFGVILVVILAWLIWMGVRAANNDSVNNSISNTANTVQNTADDLSTSAQTQVVTLSTQNSSGQQGTATLTAKGDQTEVRVQMSGNIPQGTPQPAHIHLSNCATIGAIKYPLNNLVNGSSTTMVNAKFADIFAALPLSINVHKSVAESSVYVACGDLRPLS